MWGAPCEQLWGKWFFTSPALLVFQSQELKTDGMPG